MFALLETLTQKKNNFLQNNDDAYYTIAEKIVIYSALRNNATHTSVQTQIHIQCVYEYICLLGFTLTWK